MNFRNPSEVWKMLKEQHQAVSQESRDGLLDLYQPIRMKPKKTVPEFRARSKLESELGGIGYNTSEQKQLRALLRGLLEKFELTAEVIREKDKSLSEVLALLILKEAILLANADDTETTVRALSTSHTVRRKMKIKCYHRDKLGHKKINVFDNPESKKYLPSKHEEKNRSSDIETLFNAALALLI
ncbi:gag-polypeptide of LTR copia-type [Gracilaria domingensis]|nr:gag-polypeptide of LTR copia-type [Gracilaria domingensis]